MSKTNPHDPKLYNEFRVEIEYKDGEAVFDGDVPVFSFKQQTKRGTVSISEKDARINNLQVEQTHRWYELPEKKSKPKETPKADK